VALEWSLKLKDGMSGPAQKAGASIAGLGDQLKKTAGAADFFYDKVGRLRHRSGRFATAAEKVSQGLGGMKDAASGAFKILDTVIGDVPTPKLGKWAQSFARLVQGLGLGGRRGQMAQAVGQTVQGIQDQLGQRLFGSITNGDVLRTMGTAGAALGAAFVAAFAAAAAAIVGVVANIAGQIASFQQDKAKTLFAFDKLLGPGGGAKAWETIRAAADKTRTSLTETARAMNNLVAAGFTLPQADTLFRQLADLKTLNPQANIDGIVRAIGQIRNIGKLQGDELNQLSEAGINVDDVYSELSKRLGKTRDEVMKLKEAGKIKSDDAIAAIQASIAKRTGSDPGAVAGKAPKSIGESWARLKETFFDMVKVDFGPMSRFFDKLQTALQGEGGQKLAASFERLFAAFGKVLDSVSIETMAGALEGFASIVDDIASGLERAAVAMEKLDKAGKFIDGVAGREGGSTAGAMTRGLFTGIADMLTGGLWSSVILAVEQWNIIDTFASAGAAMVEGIMSGVSGKFDALMAKMSSLGTSALNAFGEAVGWGSPAREFFPIGRSIPQGVGVGVEQGTPDLTGAMDAMAGVAQARAAGQMVGRSITQTRSTSTRSANINVQQNDPAQLGQQIRQIVRQEMRLATA
jgi:tape measure domain-containing protein